MAFPEGKRSPWQSAPGGGMFYVASQARFAVSRLPGVLAPRGPLYAARRSGGLLRLSKITTRSEKRRPEQAPTTKAGGYRELQFRPAFFPGRPDDVCPVGNVCRPTTQTWPTASCAERHEVDRVECRRLMHQRSDGYFRARRARRRCTRPCPQLLSGGTSRLRVREGQPALDV